MFWDNVDITVTAGKGGDGLVSFRRARGEAKGGPDGGDGGDGGSVIITATPELNTLVEYARRREFSAPNGQPGKTGRRHGKSAEDLELKVPVGTLVSEGEAVIADLVAGGQSVRAAKGGKGGFGNAHFTSSVRQTPRHAELGEPGERKELRLELKLVADVGLVGVPSVGKSTFLAAVTAAKPKVAEYPFTTTVPQLGIATVDDRSLTVADIPGLIEGAHQGKGLGDAFLRHIERTRVIVHLLDATAPDPLADYEAVRHELESYSQALAGKPELVALNKSDVLDDELKRLVTDDVSRRLGRRVYLVSAASHEGVTGLLRAAARIASQPVPEPAPVMPVFTLADLAPKAVSVEAADGAYQVTGTKLERLANQTDFANEGAAERFWWIFDKLGAGKRLDKLGARPGATVIVAGKELAWPG